MIFYNIQGLSRQKIVYLKKKHVFMKYMVNVYTNRMAICMNKSHIMMNTTVINEFHKF